MKVLLRSFFIQACWNFEDMQSVGFLYAVLPGLREIYGDDVEGLREAAKRHVEFFNAHPYLANSAMGLALRLEVMVKEGKMDAGSVNSTKVGLMGSLGAIGDSFFWGSVKPMASILGVLVSLFSPVLGVLFMLGFYNYFHLDSRIKGFDSGLRGSEGIYRFLKEGRFAEKNEAFRGLLLVLMGVYLGYYVGSVIPHPFSLGVASVHFATCLVLVVALEFVYRKISVVSELVVFSALFVVLLSLVAR